MRYALSLTAVLVFAACDTMAPSSDAAPTLSLADARTADVLYDLAPLSVGESFAITAEGPSTSVSLRSDRTEEGYALSLDLGSLRPERVEVRYLAHGQEVAPTAELAVDGPLEAGTSDEGPDSWHYVWRDGEWHLVKDYRREGLSNARTTGTAGFTTAAGETVRVTDVEFRLIGVEAPAPTAVRFESPSAFAFAERQVNGELVASETLR